MKKTQKVLALVLALLMVAISLAACAKGEGGDTTPAATTAVNGEQGNTPEQTTGTAETEAPKNEYGITIVPDDLPESADLQNRDFTVHTRGNVERYEWLATEETGETLNDAIYRRNTRIEDRFKIKINVIAEGSWKDYADNLVKVKGSISSGDGAYDLLAGYSTPASSLATTGLILNLNDVNYINFEKPWWSDDFYKTFTIGNKTYFGIGSLSTSMLYSMECIFVNTAILKEVDENYNIYSKVDNFEWTWDEMNRVGALAYFDVNGNQVADYGDRFGYASCEHNSNPIYGFLYATGVKMVTRDETDTPVLYDDYNRLVAIGEKIIEIFFNTPTNYSYDNSTVLKFEDGNVLFLHHWLYGGQTKYSKTMDEYGIVPIPLFDSDQKKYATPIQGGMHMYCIPIDVKNIDDDAMIVEALAAESYHSLMPAYYEVALKTRYVKDADTSRMIDIMYDNLNFDFGYVYNSTIKYLNSFSAMVTSKRAGTSAINSAFRTSKKLLDDLVKNIQEAH